MGKKMINHTFRGEVEAKLKDFLLKHDFQFLSAAKRQELGVGLPQRDYDQRNMTALFWLSGNVILEIYSDLQGGEVNCCIGELVDGKLQETSLKYLYELSPLTPVEILNIQRQPRTLDAQLATVIQKLNVLNFSTLR